MPANIVEVAVGFRGHTGGIEPEDRLRLDRAMEVSETIEARISDVDRAAETATGAAGIATAAAETAAKNAADLAGPALAESILAGVAAEADRADTARTGAEAAASSVAGAVGAEASERRAMIRSASVAGYAAIVMDADKNSTWLAARAIDGAPPDWVIDHLVGRMEAPLGVVDLVDGLNAETETRSSLARIGTAHGLAAAVIDSAERLTWLAASAVDGGMPDWVADHVADRIAARLNISAALPSDRALIGGEVVPILPDMTRMAGWGSSTMEYMGAEIAAEMGGLGVSYYNGGDAGVLASHTLAQMGARPALLTVVGGQIPASGPVSVTASNMTASSQMRAFAGTLAGVHGSLSSTQTELTFTRSAGGEVVAVSADTPFLPTVGPQYRDAINLLNIGKNDVYNVDLAPLVVAKTAEAFAYSRPFFRRNVVVGHFVNRDSPDVSPIRTSVLEINAAYAAQYGPLYFDLQAYVTGQQVWVDAGLTPTADDLSYQLRGNKPPSLSLDDGHLNAVGDAAVAKALRRFAVNLGWYKEGPA